MLDCTSSRSRCSSTIFVDSSEEVDVEKSMRQLATLTISASSERVEIANVVALIFYHFELPRRSRLEERCWRDSDPGGTGLANEYEEGSVVIHQGVCIGCEYCIHACPSKVITKDDITGKAHKCTMCSDRISKNKQSFCVQACPAAARVPLVGRNHPKGNDTGSGRRPIHLRGKTDPKPNQINGSIITLIESCPLAVSSNPKPASASGSRCVTISPTLTM